MGEPYTGGVQSTQASGTASAPTAGTAFVTAAAPTAGWYEIQGVFVIAGAVETAQLNVALNANNAQWTAFPSGQGVNNPITFRVPQILLDGSHNVTLTAIANATASTKYSGNLILTQVEE